MPTYKIMQKDGKSDKLDGIRAEFNDECRRLNAWYKSNWAAKETQKLLRKINYPEMQIIFSSRLSRGALFISFQVVPHVNLPKNFYDSAVMKFTKGDLTIIKLGGKAEKVLA